MTDLVFYFQVHQPFRLRRYTFFDIGGAPDYFDDPENERIARRVAERCYLPMNALLLELIERHAGKFRCAFSVSGCAIEQLERWAPEALESFRTLADTGCVEFLCETSRHSLAFLADESEFRAQIEEQAETVERVFGQEPRTFRNTELVVSNQVARSAEELGFEVILGEGADQLLDWRSPHRVYRPQGCESIKLLLRSYRFSDDIAFRFSNRTWEHYPLSAETFARWIHELPEQDEIVGLFMDYETFGEHQWRETGVFEFMRHLPGHVLEHPRFRFRTPYEAAAAREPVALLDIPRPVSWADAERDLTAWLGNPMQRSAHDALHSIGADVRRAALAGSPEHLERWRKLSTSDHFYYMCTKWFSDGDVHKYFSPYSTPHDAFVAFMNVLDDLARRCGVPLPGNARDAGVARAAPTSPIDPLEVSP